DPEWEAIARRLAGESEGVPGADGPVRAELGAAPAREKSFAQEHRSIPSGCYDRELRRSEDPVQRGRPDIEHRRADERNRVMTTNHRIRLNSRPVGTPTEENYLLDEVPVPSPGEGEVLLRTLYLSLDPYMRGRMSDAKSYAAPVEVGDVMVGATVSEVVESNAHDFSTGDIVLGYGGWQEYSVESTGHL